jgi:uncharacterized protein (DUF2062 family)
MASASSPASPSRALKRAGRFHRAIYELRTEGTSRRRDAAAVGIGVFIGCSPLWGLHLLLCWLIGRLANLNRLKLYLAANLVNPLVAPFILLAEIQAGAWLRQGYPHALSIETIKQTNPWLFGEDLVVGSLIIGAALAVAGAAVTYLSVGRRSSSPAFDRVAREAADRYLVTGITSWEFARGKLRGDPIYRAVLSNGLLPTGGTLIDVGCGRGLALALLADVRREVDEERWPQTAPMPPRFDRLIGVELQARVAAVARKALEGDAEIVEDDAARMRLEPCRAILLFDVLHLMSAADQDALLTALSQVLEPGGVLLVREADRDDGWKFHAVRAGNLLKALAFGHFSQRFHFRGVIEWTAALQKLGLVVDSRPMGHGTPFANVLLRATRPVR